MTKSFRVGKFTCTYHLPDTLGPDRKRSRATWSPYLPKKLSDTETAQYIVGRDAAYAEMAKRLGIPGVVVPLADHIQGDMAKLGEDPSMH